MKSSLKKKKDKGQRWGGEGESKIRERLKESSAADNKLTLNFGWGGLHITEGEKWLNHIRAYYFLLKSLVVGSLRQVWKLYRFIIDFLSFSHLRT